MKTKHDWKKADAMTDSEIVAAAMSDADSVPLSDEAFKRVKLTPLVKTIRRALKLSQDEFAARFRIPVGTLRDWEQGRKEPDAATRAYLIVIGRDPEAVSKALATAA
jgi:putative transcriptional regulator